MRVRLTLILLLAFCLLTGRASAFDFAKILLPRACPLHILIGADASAVAALTSRSQTNPSVKTLPSPDFHTHEPGARTLLTELER
jgi:hypothetical protein